MQRDATGKFTHNWDSEAKKRFSVTLTSTAWRLLEEEARKHHISRSEVIERTARNFGLARNQQSGISGPETRQECLEPFNSSSQKQNDVTSSSLQDSKPLQELFWEQQQEIMTLQRQKQELESLLENSPNTIARFDSELLENISDAFVILNHDWCYTYVNKAAVKLLRKTPTELLGKHIWNEVFPELVDKTISQKLHQAITEQASVTWEEHDQSLHRWLEMNAYPFEKGIALCFRDISERKQLEVESQYQKQQFKMLAENSPDIIARFDPEGRHLYISPCIERATGFPATAFIGRTNEELEMPDDLCLAWRKGLEKVCATGQEQQFDFEFLTPQGRRWYQSHLVPEFAEDGSIKSILSITRDFHHYKQAEQALRQSEERLRFALEAAGMMAWEWNPWTRQVVRSHTAQQIMGVDGDSVPREDSDYWNLIHPDDHDRVWVLVEQAISQKSPYSAEFRMIKPDGSLRWMFDRGRVICDDAGNVIHMSGVLQDITERKQAEFALAESNQTLQAIIQACPLAIVGLSADGTVRIWNPAAELIFGWSQEEVLGKFLPAVPDDKMNEFLANLALMTQKRSLAGVETQRQKKGNIRLDVELWSAPVDEALSGISCVSVIADITARKRTEAALRLNEERLHSFVTANVIGILFGDLEGGIQEANDEFLRIVGYSREDLESGNLKWIDITPPKYLPLDEAAIIEARKRRACTPYEKEYIRKDGSRVPVLVGFGLVLAVREEAVAFILDLSDRKQAEESLRQSEERLRLALLVGKSGIWDWDIVNNHITWSEQIYQFHGLTPETFSGKVEDFGQLIHPEDQEKVSGAIQKALQERASYEIEFRAVQPTGEIRWLSTTGGVIFNQQGAPVRMLGATIDITDRKGIEAEREQLLKREQAARVEAESANRVKDEFLAVLSHELRTPLNPILGWVKLLRTRQLDSATSTRALATIERNAKLQAQLIEDLLDISRILQGKLNLNICSINLINIIEAVLETVRLSIEAKGIQIQLRLDPEVQPVNGDANRLQQVMWNLLSNAIKFTPSSGSVVVQLEQVGTSAQIQVSDTGQGISQNFLPYVFEYFRQADSSTTRQFGGLGLGLAISRQIVELHGGTIRADSPGEGLGATFTVCLPTIMDRLKGSTSSELLTQATVLTGLQILVVDDEVDNLELVQFILEQTGATVLTAQSAAAALQQLRQFRIDILIADIGMPEMDGYALMKQIRALAQEQNDQIPTFSGVIPKAIALTAYAGDLNQQQALNAGFQIHLSKPVDPETLVKAIGNLVSRDTSHQFKS